MIIINSVISEQDIAELFKLYRTLPNWYTDEQGRERERFHCSGNGRVLITDYTVEEVGFVIDKIINSVKSYADIEILYPRILKYGHQCYLPAHVDGAGSYNFHQHTDYSIIIAMNPTSVYSGGELVFDRHDVVNLEPGDMAFFDYKQVHEIRPVKKGIRYSLNFRCKSKG